MRVTDPPRGHQEVTRHELSRRRLLQRPDRRAAHRRQHREREAEGGVADL